MKDFLLKYKFFIVGVLLVFALLFIFRREDIVIIDSVNGIFTYDGKWRYNRNFSRYDGKYYIYDGDTYLGKYDLNYVDGWNVYNKKKSFSYDYSLFASSSKKISLISVNESNYDSDLTFINDYLYNRKGINSMYDSFDYSSYYYDFDSDGEDEKLFIVTDFSMMNDSVMHSYIFILDSGNYFDIRESVTSDLSKVELYSLSRVFSKDGKVNFIINIDFFSHPENMCQELYTFDGNVHNLYECEWVLP